MGFWDGKIKSCWEMCNCPSTIPNSAPELSKTGNFHAGKLRVPIASLMTTVPPAVHTVFVRSVASIRDTAIVSPSKIKLFRPGI